MFLVEAIALEASAYLRFEVEQSAKLGIVRHEQASAIAGLGSPRREGD